MYLSTLLSYPTYYFHGEVDSQSAADLVVWISGRVRHKNLTIMLTTFGGSMHHALAAYDSMKLLKNVTKIHTVALGACQSAGIVMLLGAEPENRFSMASTRFMAHPVASRSAEERYACDAIRPPAETLREMERITGHDLAETYRVQDLMVRAYCKNTGLREVDARELIGREKTFFTAEEALTHGFISQVLEPEPEPIRKSWLQRLGRRA